MREKKITKLALFSNEYLYKATILDWGIPYESIFISAMDGDKEKLTFVIINADKKSIPDQLKTTNGFYDAWGMVPEYVLSKEYCNIDLTKPYQVMTYGDLLK